MFANRRLRHRRDEIGTGEFPNAQVNKIYLQLTLFAGVSIHEIEMQWVSQSEAQGISCLSYRIVEASTRETNRSGAFSMTAKTISEIYVIRPISCFAVLWLIPSESRLQSDLRAQKRDRNFIPHR